MKADVHKDTYSRGEFALDFLTFNSIGTLAYGSLSAAFPIATGGAIAIAAAHSFLDAHNSKSKVIRIAAIVTAVGLATLTFPLAISTLTGHTITLLALETALLTTTAQLLAKTAIYCLFYTGLIFRDLFFFSFPSNLLSLTKGDALRLKGHCLDRPSRLSSTSLDFQQKIKELLIQHGLDPLPLTDFSELGEGWTKQALESLHTADLRTLSFPKRAQIAELFFGYDLPPQKCRYTLNELPIIDRKELAKPLSPNQLAWVHLRAKLDPDFSPSASLSHKFYSLKLPAPRNVWISLPPLASAKEVENLEPYQLSWYQNYYAANLKQHSVLSKEVKQALKKRLIANVVLPAYQPPPPPRPPLITQQHLAGAAAITAVALLALAAYAYFPTSPPAPFQLALPTCPAPFHNVTIAPPASSFFAMPSVQVPSIQLPNPLRLLPAPPPDEVVKEPVSLVPYFFLVPFILLLSKSGREEAPMPEEEEEEEEESVLAAASPLATPGDGDVSRDNIVPATGPRFPALQEAVEGDSPAPLSAWRPNAKCRRFCLRPELGTPELTPKRMLAGLDSPPPLERPSVVRRLFGRAVHLESRPEISMSKIYTFLKIGKSGRADCYRKIRDGLWILNKIANGETPEKHEQQLMHACWALVAMALADDPDYSFGAIEVDGETFYRYFLAQPRIVKRENGEGFTANLPGLPGGKRTVTVTLDGGAGVGAAAADVTTSVVLS